MQDFKRKEADLVYRINLNGQDVVFYLLMELQSSVDYRMPYRLLLYQVEIWRYLLESNTKAMENRKTFQLPPIVPIVLYNGEAKWTASRQFRQLLSHEHMFGTELLNFEYILIDVARYSEEDLLAISNTIGAVFLLDQIEDQKQLQQRLHKMLHIIQRLPEENQQKFMTWMSNIMLHKLPKQELSLQQWLQSMKGDATLMGLEKVLDEIERKGHQEGKESVARKLISMNMDTAMIQQATELTSEKIEQLRRQREL